MSKSEKPHLNTIIMGHVDHGKSTTTGHLLYLAGAIDERTIKAFEEEAQKMGKGTFKFAWVLDNLKEERERGVTIDLRFLKFETKKYYFTVIDAPGHRDFVKNMITGASQADAALLVVSAKPGETEAGIGATGQAREHVFLLKVLGVQQIIVVLNKMDAANYDEARYKLVKEEVGKLLKNVGYDINKILFVPVSAWEGENIAKKQGKMKWYTG